MNAYLLSFVEGTLTERFRMIELRGFSREITHLASLMMVVMQKAGGMLQNMRLRKQENSWQIPTAINRLCALSIFSDRQITRDIRKGMVGGRTGSV